MSDKTRKIYHSLVEGATSGLSDKALFQHVVDECPKATSKKIVKASLLALSDPDLKEAAILHTIYALAIKHRLDPFTKDDIEDEDAPKPKKAKLSPKASPPQPAAET